jgi:hypothetical protein
MNRRKRITKSSDALSKVSRAVLGPDATFTILERITTGLEDEQAR